MVPQRMEAGQKLEPASHLIFPINSTSAKKPVPPRLLGISEQKKRTDLVCLIVMKEFITFQVCFWAKWPRFAVCYHWQTDFTRACLPIFSLWVSIRHPRLDSEGVYCTPLSLNLLQEFLIPGYSPRCFFGRGSEGVSEKTENRSLLPSQPGRWNRGRFQLHPKSRVNM